MIRPLGLGVAVLVAVLAVSKGAHAQAPPAASPPPAPSASPSAAPNPIGPALGNNDPCTSISAIVSRPTLTNSVCTVRPNHVEIEMGYLNTTSSSGSNTVTYPQTLIRVGTTIPALELQIAPPEVTRASAGGTVIGTNSLTNRPQRWSSFVPSFVVMASLPNSTGVYAEIAQFSNANGPGTATRVQYIYGLSRAVGPRVQLDASASVSPTTATGKYHGVGFGMSYYF